jgi:hypothetical protein
LTVGIKGWATEKVLRSLASTSMFLTGYYDRWVSRTGTKAKLFGLALSAQIVDNIPVESHDLTLDSVVSASGSILSNRR